MGSYARCEFIEGRGGGRTGGGKTTDSPTKVGIRNLKKEEREETTGHGAGVALNQSRRGQQDLLTMCSGTESRGGLAGTIKGK